jgi:hypothetical protein
MNINKTQALKLIEETKGRFFGVSFVKKDGSLRAMNAQYKKQTPKLGYVILKDNNVNTKTKLRNVNLQTIKSLRIKGVEYKVK